MNRIPLWSAVTPRFLLFRSCPVFFGWSSVYRLFFDFFSVVDINSFDIIFFLSFVFCICWTVFGTTKSFSSIHLSHNFLSLIDVMNFDMCRSVLKFGKCQFFSNSMNFSEWSSSVSMLELFRVPMPKENFVVFSFLFVFQFVSVIIVL